MANVLSFTTPLMRRSVGFDRFNDLFESLFEEKAASYDNYPPHNIEKLDDDSYRITMAVAGFTMEDLSIILNDDRLTITGQKKDQHQDEAEILHHGIATRNFERSFRLADHIKVKDASLQDGLLIIQLEREVPEEKKPRLIKINADSPALSHKRKHKH